MTTQRTAIRRITYMGIMGAILFALKLAMAGLPNIEPVSLLIMVYALHFPKETVGAIGVYVMLEGLLFGFGMWWFSYLYIWFILYFAVRATRRFAGVLFNSLLSGLYGLLFGTFTSLPYFLTMGWAGGVAYIIAGLVYFDVLHAAGNLVASLLLFAPLNKLFALLASRAGKQLP